MLMSHLCTLPKSSLRKIGSLERLYLRLLSLRRWLCGGLFALLSVAEVSMIISSIRLLLLLAVAITSFKAYAWPDGVEPSISYRHYSVQPLLVVASYMELEMQKILEPKMTSLRGVDISAPERMSDVEKANLTDIKISYAKLGKAKAAFAYFETFYYQHYSAYEGHNRLTPREMARIIDHLTLLNKYFITLKSRRFMSKILKPHEVEQLEILSLRNSMLMQRLSLEINNVYKAHVNKPDKLKALFNGIEMNNVSHPEDAIATLNHLIPRLARLEAEAKIKFCSALF